MQHKNAGNRHSFIYTHKHTLHTYFFYLFRNILCSIVVYPSFPYKPFLDDSSMYTIKYTVATRIHSCTNYVVASRHTPHFQTPIYIHTHLRVHTYIHTPQVH